MVTPIILAAGLGSRLRPGGLPKCLSVLPGGRTILRRQLDSLESVLGFAESDVTIVVGYRAEDIAEAAPRARLVYNEDYDVTNTSKSLLRGLRKRRGGALWMNGDVVFDPMILGRALPLLAADESFVVVDTATVADEEVKYTLSGDGNIAQLSKTSLTPDTRWEGEAVGINYLSAADVPAVARRLREVGDQDYFERAIELAIAGGEVRMRPLDITGLGAVEVDTPADLQAATDLVSAGQYAARRTLGFRPREHQDNRA